MKKIYSILTLVLLTASVFLTQQATAQAPQKMSYQAVIRNSSNALLVNTAVGIKISVLQGTASGTAVYVETQTATTNANGLVSIQIGTGTASTGTFAGIDWSPGPYFIKTETDPAGGTYYTITGTQEMLSVPFAMYAAKSGDATTMGAIGGSSSTNGGTITAGVLSLAPADGSNGGIVTNGTQTIGGAKTFTQSVTANSFVKTGGVSSQYLMADGSTSPRTALGPVTTSTVNGATLTNGVLSLAQADATNSGIVTPFTQTFGGDKIFTQSVTAGSFVKTGGVSSQYLMADGSTSPRTALGPVTTSTANGATLTNGILSLAQADGTNSGIVTPFTQTFGGDKTFTQSVTANSFVKTGGVSSQYLMADGSTSPRITLGAVGGTSASNGATLTNGILSLTPADATNSGIVTPFTQTFGGNKSFNDNVTANSFIKTGGVSSQYLMADGSTSPRITLGAVGGTSASNGATLTNGILSLTPADATNSGIVTPFTQTFGGNKTFTSAIKITAGTPGEGKVLTSDATGLARWQSSSPCGYAIGQNVTALGGIIFYLDASGCHGLVCAPTDQSTGIRWRSNLATMNTTAYADCVGGGAGNTSMIIYNQGATATSYAAGLARAYTGGDFDGWYLPSKYELNLMYKNIGQGNVLGLGNVGGFASWYYWSSTEGGIDSAYLQAFTDGSYGQGLKNDLIFVRAVRAF